MTTTMCAHCGEEEAVTLRVNKEDPSLSGVDVGWWETTEILENSDVGDDAEFYTIEDFCSGTCIHFAGEYRHAMVEYD